MKTKTTKSTEPTTEQKRVYGRTGMPTPATAVYRAKDRSPFDHKMEVRAWIIVNTQAESVVSVNLYNGRAGINFDNTKTQPLLPNDPRWLKRLERFEKVAISECPIAIEVKRRGRKAGVR